MSAPTTVTLPPQTSTAKYSWERGPLKLIQTPISQTGATDDYTFVASEMTLVHNCIVRALNSIYIQAPHVPIPDHASFTKYCIAAFEGLEAHHDGEEEFMFPEIERITGEKGLMDVNISQHAAFHTGFHAWAEWLKEVGAGRQAFDGQKCRTIMDSFIAPLSQHLADEIPTLISLSKFGDKLPLKALSKQEGDIVMGNLSKTTQLPIFFANHDTSFEGGIHHFPPIPAAVIFVLREVFGRWNADWWKFGTVAFNGQPRELLYQGE